MSTKQILNSPFDDSVVRSLRAGNEVLLSGVVYTARDAAHKRLCARIAENKPLPVDLQGQAIYFTGPTPPKPGGILGSAGPTTSSRMDAYSPLLIEHAGLKAMIGKGNRTSSVIESMKKFGCVYFAATGGAGVLISEAIRAAEIVCYEDLGPEAIYRLELDTLPLIVAIDCEGNNLYESAKQAAPA
jgi:fumarate hydratase subunit beta